MPLASRRGRARRSWCVLPLWRAQRATSGRRNAHAQHAVHSVEARAPALLFPAPPPLLALHASPNPPPQRPPPPQVWRCAAELQPGAFAAIDRAAARNLARVQEAFRRQRVGPHHFQGSTGYGHGDLGREALDNVFADIMGAEAALVRIQFMSGTHAIAAALYAVLRPGDEMLAVAGK